MFLTIAMMNARLLVLAAMVLLVVLLIALMIVMLQKWFRRPAKPGEGANRCGKCGYNVTGLTVFDCPECGCDVREVGIVRTQPNTAKSFALALFLAFAILFCIIGGMMVFWVSDTAPPPVQFGPMGFTASLSTDGSPSGNLMLQDEVVTYNDKTTIIFDKQSIDNVPTDAWALSQTLWNLLANGPWNLTTEELADIILTIDGRDYRVGDYATIERISE